MIVDNCTLPLGVTPPANASCYDLCVDEPNGCTRAYIEYDECFTACPPIACYTAPPSQYATCVQGVWVITPPPSTVVISGNLTVTTTPVVINGSVTFAPTAITIISVSGAVDGAPRVAVTGTIRPTI